MTGAAYDIVAVGIPRHGELSLTFADGTQGDVYVLDHMWGPAFEQARTPDGFAEAYVDPEGRTVAWPGEVDLAPDTFYIRVSTGAWPPDLN